MKFSLAIRTMMKRTGITQCVLADRLSVKQGTVASAIARNNLLTDNLVKWADACGYEVVLQPKILGHNDLQIPITNEN